MVTLHAAQAERRGASMRGMQRSIERMQRSTRAPPPARNCAVRPPLLDALRPHRAPGRFGSFRCRLPRCKPQQTAPPARASRCSP
jgi:hypothetical protein